MRNTFMRTFGPAVFIFFLCLGLTFGATYLSYRGSRAETVGRFERGASTIVNSLKTRMTVYINAIIYTRNLFDISPNLSAEEFSRFIDSMQLATELPGIYTMGYIKRMTTAEALAFARKTGHRYGSSGALPNQPYHDIIAYFKPIATTTATALGMDMRVGTERITAMDRARDTGEPVATDMAVPISSVTAPVQYLFLVFVPQYKRGMPTNTVEERRKALVGYVYGAFRAGHLFSRIFGDKANAAPSFTRLIVEVFDGKHIRPDRLMHAEGDPAEADAQLTKNLGFFAADHHWTLRITAPNDFTLRFSYFSPFLILFAGFITTISVTVLMYRSQRLAARLSEDIDARKRSAAVALENTTLYRELDLARQEADSANHAKSMFLANISHEMRTPLGIMLGYAEVALEQSDLEEIKANLATIIKNGKELTQIIGDVLDISKIEANSLVIEESAVNLPQMIEELQLIWSPRARAKNLDLEIRLLPGVPPVIRTDRTRLKQILVNLFSNAVKFTEQGFVRLTISSESGQLFFAVEDSGTGISVENQKRLFKSFSQIDSSITRKVGGNGLGLALSKQLAIALNGELKLEKSAVGKGSQFLLQIPEVALASSVTIETISEKQKLTSLNGLRVLVVDDSQDNQALIRYILQKAEAQVEVAGDGEQAFVKAATDPFDVILMDLQMPVLDGYGALEKLQKAHVKIPVIALTAHSIKEERDRALQLGFYAYLTKPIDREGLLQTIRSVSIFS